MQVSRAETVQARCGTKAILVAFCWGALLGLVGCQTFDVRSDWDDAVALESMKRFHFEDPPIVEGANPFADNSLLRNRVRAGIEQVLEERGFERAGARASADFVVTYGVQLEEELRVDGVTLGTGMGSWNRGYAYGGAASTTSRVNAYQEATLIIDVLAPESGDLAWRGWGRGMLTTRDRNRSDERMHEGIRAILERFPPVAGD